MSLGSVLLGYFHRFPSTEISEHFLVLVIIIKTSVGGISQGTDDILYSHAVFILRSLVV